MSNNGKGGLTLLIYILCLACLAVLYLIGCNVIILPILLR
jgi:hypothetical protein